nr:unnamed protein product [Spirometra erinaceieuropaei]
MTTLNLPLFPITVAFYNVSSYSLPSYRFIQKDWYHSQLLIWSLELDTCEFQMSVYFLLSFGIILLFPAFELVNELPF